VRVDEAGQEHADAEVDDLGGWALERADLTLVTDRDDAVAPRRDGLGLRPRVVDGPDATAAEYDVGRDGRR